MKITKAEQRKQALLNHYSSLEKLAILCGLENPDGKKLSLKLFKLEQIANKAATNYCNGEIEHFQYEDIVNPIEDKVKLLFNQQLKGFFVNSDPRGYSLKIQDSTFKELYREKTGLTSDWGGYGILSPDLTPDAFRN